MRLNLDRETEFMAFLRLIEKLANDIGRLDQKILQERDKNEVLLEQNCRLKLENSNLENKIKGKSLVGTKEHKEGMVHVRKGTFTFFSKRTGV